jgi:hypothetical protein
MLRIVATLDRVPEPLDKNSVLHVYDAFETSEVHEIIQSKGTPKYVVNDHYSYLDNDIDGHYCLPLYAEMTAQHYQKFPEIQVAPDTICAFNFMINKKQINRHLCMKFVEIFELKKYDYTWSGIGRDFDMSDIILELDSLGDDSPIRSKEKGKLLSPVSKIKPKFFYYDQDSVTDGNDIIISNYGGNFWTWDTFLHKMFYGSAVSLITESVRFQKAAVFTEKTIYSVLGLTLPIWIGGYQQARYWKNLGFDVFDDVINHDYQHYDTLIERCYYAFNLNIDLLANFGKAKQARLDCLGRLIKNRDLLQSGQISSRIDSMIADFPQDLQEPAAKIRSRILKAKNNNK